MVGADKRGRKKEKSRAIEKGDKSPKGLLIMLARIQAEESMTYLSEMIQDNLAKMTIKILSLQSLIRFALISPVIIMIKSVSS